MDNIIEKIEYRDYTINVCIDDNPESPREWGRESKMVCTHKHYDLGDEQLPHDAFNSWEEAEEYYKAQAYKGVILPLYLYDHSGITMNTTGFSCTWDSGQVGFIFFPKDNKDVIEQYASSDVSEMKKHLIAEVEEYDTYIRGEVYGYEIYNADDDIVESCWGFYGDTDYMISEAKGSIDYTIEAEEKRQKRLFYDSQKANYVWDIFECAGVTI